MQKITFDKIINCPSGHLIGINLKPSPIKSEAVGAVATMTGSKLTYALAHWRLGHMNKNEVKSTAAKYGWKIMDMETASDKPCPHCATAKIRQTNINKESGTRATKPGERLFVDISSVNGTSLGGSKFFALIIDQYSSFKWGLFLKTKDDLSEKFLPIAKQLACNQTPIRNIRCNNAGENKGLERRLRDEGFNIKFEYTPPGSSQYNGVGERAFPTIYGKIRATFNSTGIEGDKKLKLWTECASTICKIDNMSIKPNKTKSPYEELFKTTAPYADNLRSFGEARVVRDIKSISFLEFENKQSDPEQRCQMAKSKLQRLLGQIKI